ncbi:polysaccharide biosynthesis/export family protein [Tropicimonas aquimaris]|uniref:Polysaccharide biosynthesis/export family protein n=1 Tax=Tropicimonas aquimaris TaxID=914152 RepID=A0ABW3ITI2_9RHOB
MIRANGIVLASCIALVGCGGGGPSSRAILHGTDVVVGRAKNDAAVNDAPYVLINVDRGIATSVTHARRADEARGFHPVGSPAGVVIGRGDVLEISIVSTAETGFMDFTTASISPISQTTLVPQEVSSDGMVRVPPLGRIKAQGMTVQQFENTLTRMLSDVLVDPAAIVRISDRQSAKVSVVGQVGVPGKYAIDESNLRLLDMISAAGGPVERSENLSVKVSRNGVTQSALMRDVLSNPHLNIYVRTNDVIEVETPENRITILGSGGTKNATLLMNEPDSTVVDVLGNGEGLANRQADRSGVFLYRDVPTSTLSQLGIETYRFTAPTVPTIFRFDLTQPESLFAAKSFEVADGDILYLSTSIKDAFEALSTFIPVPADYIADWTIDGTNVILAD